jgi:hypothetical protein
MTRQLKTIYLLSILPLLTGSLVFFYWFYKRIYFALNVNIELLSLFILLGFALYAIITLILCTAIVVKDRDNWKKIIIPILIIVLTLPVIHLYGTVYTELSSKAYVRIINDTEGQINRIWSDNFELTYPEEEGDDFVISFSPVYIYDWRIGRSNSEIDYKVNRLRIDLKLKSDSIETYKLPCFEKGDCQTIHVSDVMNTK